MKLRLLPIAAVLLILSAARADEPARVPLPAVYKDECGSCHVAYPPRLLAAADWRTIVAGLARHFGSDASLDPARAREIGAFLTANAGRREAGGREPRITTGEWFRREHRDGHDGLSAALWKSPAVGSPANCGACHRQAAGGDYGERSLRLPGNGRRGD